MTSPIFGRKIRLIVEDRDGNSNLFPRTVIEDLNVEFQVTRTLSKEPNTLTAMVYNLNENTRQRLQVKPNTFVTLEVAYTGGEFQKIFESKVRRVTHSRPDGSLQTVIEAGDGEKAQRFFINRRFGRGASLRQVLRALVRAMEVGPGNIDEATRSYRRNGLPTSFQTGITLFGYAESELNELLGSLGLEYSIQDEQIQLMEAGEAFGNGLPVLQLTSGTGLVDTPSINNEGIMEARALILPGIVPGAVVNIDSEFVSGDFRIDDAVYVGSLFGPDFFVDIEGQQPSSKVKNPK